MTLDLAEWATPYAIQAGLPLLPAHLSTIIRSLALWTTLQLLSSLVSPYIFPDTYPKLKRSTRISWDVHFVALVHAAIITPLCGKVWWDVYQQGGLNGTHPLALRRVYGYTFEAGQVYAIAIGYFIWDTVVSILFDGPAFVAHGVVALTAFVLVYHPIFMYDGLGFLLWELSTPFLNIHWFLDKLGKTGSKIQLINAVFLLSTYVIARLTFGVYNSYSWFMNVNFPATPHVPPIPISYRVFYTLGNITLNSLNFIWFRAMIRAVQKRFTAAPADGSNKLDAKAIAEGKQSVQVGVTGKDDSQFEREAGVGKYSRPDIGSYGGEREARWRKVAKSAE
ncbi:uncharacterized conserved protein [Ceraceosorus bombacis]|uniref:Uncharacterized conserved protein n=1 Tax=Ceraceosorus bombacis TaxID=401625 RepID=A0A0P1BLY9_9BASI|nr:uncharacterized conserved protein [Ceraceosorus bombacis]